MSKGEIMSVDKVWEWGQRWYADRLDPNWRQRTVEEMEAILTATGLTGPFWSLR